MSASLQGASASLEENPVARVAGGALGAPETEGLKCRAAPPLTSRVTLGRLAPSLRLTCLIY